MSQFLFSAKNRENRDVTERINAVNVSAARYALETRGYQAIVFHTDDMAASVDQSLGIDESKYRSIWSPEAELASRNGRSVPARIFGHLPKLFPIWVPVLVWNIYAGIHQDEWLPLLIAVVADLWFLKFYILLILPGLAHHWMLEAQVWHRWGKVRFWVRVIFWLKRIGKCRVADFPLHMQLAKAMASEGKLTEALRIVAPHERDPKMVRSTYLLQLSTLYRYAKDYESMSRCEKEAIEQGTGSAGELLAYAGGLAQYHKKTAEARDLLAQAKEKEITPQVARFLTFYEGVIAVEEKQYGEAIPLLQRSLELAGPVLNQPLMQAWCIRVKAYLCIALGNSGQKDPARELLEEVTPMLTASRSAELLQRCAAACQ